MEKENAVKDRNILAAHVREKKKSRCILTTANWGKEETFSEDRSIRKEKVRQIEGKYDEDDEWHRAIGDGKWDIDNLKERMWLATSCRVSF